MFRGAALQGPLVFRSPRSNGATPETVAPRHADNERVAGISSALCPQDGLRLFVERAFLDRGGGVRLPRDAATVVPHKWLVAVLRASAMLGGC
jgi:hypothetical protein